MQLKNIILNHSCRFKAKPILVSVALKADNFEAKLKLVLHDAVALRDRLQVGCSMKHTLFATYFATFLGLQ